MNKVIIFTYLLFIQAQLVNKLISIFIELLIDLYPLQKYFFSELFVFNFLNFHLSLTVI